MTDLIENDSDAELDDISGVQLFNVEEAKAEAEKLEEKKSVLSRLRAFLSGKRDQAKDKDGEEPEEKPKKDKPSVGKSVKILRETTSEDMRKINDFLGAIETQLDKVDEQNNMLLSQLGTLKKNNEALLDQVKVLTENNNQLTQNNNQLTQQYNDMKKREKISKILAIISATLAIGLSAYNILRLIFQW